MWNETRPKWQSQSGGPKVADTERDKSPPLQQSASAAGRHVPACGGAGRLHECCAKVAAHTTTAQTVWVVNFYSTMNAKK